jgi:hypothetical protein
VAEPLRRRTIEARRDKGLRKTGAIGFGTALLADRKVVLLRTLAFVCMLWEYVSRLAKDHKNVSVLYVCVFWRGEARHLEQSQPRFSEPTARDSWQVGFLLLVR